MATRREIYLATLLLKERLERISGKKVIFEDKKEPNKKAREVTRASITKAGENIQKEIDKFQSAMNELKEKQKAISKELKKYSKRPDVIKYLDYLDDLKEEMYKANEKSIKLQTEIDGVLTEGEFTLNVKEGGTTTFSYKTAFDNLYKILTPALKATADTLKEATKKVSEDRRDILSHIQQLNREMVIHNRTYMSEGMADKIKKFFSGLYKRVRGWIKSFSSLNRTFDKSLSILNKVQK